VSSNSGKTGSFLRDLIMTFLLSLILNLIKQEIKWDFIKNTEIKTFDRI